MFIYQPYTYLIGWSHLDKWYYGVRVAKISFCLYETGCHPNDFWVTYFTSSNEVQKYRKEYGDPNVIQIRKTFDDPVKAFEWEKKVLKRLNIYFNDRWLNNSICGDFIMNDTTKRKISQSNRKPKSKEHAANISKGRKGIIFSESHRDNIRKAGLGKTQSEQTKHKKSLTMSKKMWFNDGNINVRREEHPGEGWSRGKFIYRTRVDPQIHEELLQSPREF